MKTVTPFGSNVRSRPTIALYVHMLSCLGFVLWCHITRNAGEAPTDVLQCYV